VPTSGRIGIGDYRDGTRVADRGWKRRFEDPIPLPRGRQLVTLEDAPSGSTSRQLSHMVNHPLTHGRYHLPGPGSGRPATGSNHHAR